MCLQLGDNNVDEKNSLPNDGVAMFRFTQCIDCVVVLAVSSYQQQSPLSLIISLEYCLKRKLHVLTSIVSRHS